jgi:hypothetical protein
MKLGDDLDQFRKRTGFGPRHRSSWRGRREAPKRSFSVAGGWLAHPAFRKWAVECQCFVSSPYKRFGEYPSCRSSSDFLAPCIASAQINSHPQKITVLGCPLLLDDLTPRAQWQWRHQRQWHRLWTWDPIPHSSQRSWRSWI